MRVIDVHTHGIGGFDTNAGSGEDILKIAEINLEEGTTDIVPTIYPSTVESMRKNMKSVGAAMAAQREADADHRGANILGVHLEGPFLNHRKKGALDGESFLKPDEYTLDKLIDGFEDIIRIITIAPELDGAMDIIRKISDRGIIASMGHSDATYSEAEAGFKAGARGITHIFNAMRGIHHRDPGIAAFGLINNEIYIEVIADPFHLDHKMIEFIFSTKNPDRIMVVSDTIKETKTDNLTYGIKNTEKILRGGAYALRVSADRLIEEGLNKEVVMNAISENPAGYLNR